MNIKYFSKSNSFINTLKYTEKIHTKYYVRHFKKYINIIIKSYNKDLLTKLIYSLKFLLLKNIIFNKYNFLGNNRFANYIKKILTASLVDVKKFTILRSPHIDENSRDQYELRLYKFTIDLKYHEFFAYINELLCIRIPRGIILDIQEKFHY